MDRQINYVGAVPQDTDLLLTNKNAMVGLGYLIAAVLGSSVSVDGLACVPTTPASMSVQVAPGSIHSLQNIDGTAYGSIAADTTNQVMKQGLVAATTTLSCPAPATTGQSVVYLVQVAYQDTDAGAAVLPYYNASNPGVPWAGPNNTGVSQNTVRKGQCLVAVKTGVAATTGTQTTPAPDAGYTGLYAVTVANGQTSITSGNIQQLSTAPFIGVKLPNVLSVIQQDTPNFAQDASVTANTISITLSPSPTLTNGMPIRVKVANSSTGPTVMSVNGGSNIACKTTSGADFTTNTVVGNGIYTFVYDANGTRLQLQGFTAATATGLVPANNLSDVSNAATSRTNLGLDTAAVKAASDGTKANVASVSGSTTAGHMAVFADGAGTVADSGFAPPFSKSFTSSQQTITTAGSLSLSHGLGAAPSLIQTYLVCQTAEYGWSVGDNYLVSFGGPYGGTSSTAEGAAVSFDSSNIYVRWSNDVPLNNLMNKSTGGYAALTNANWKLVVKAFA